MQFSNLKNQPNKNTQENSVPLKNAQLLPFRISHEHSAKDK